MIDVTCDRESEEACKNYFYFNGVWYAGCNIARKLKQSLDESEDQPDFEDLPEDFKNYLEGMIEESKSERSSFRDYFTHQKMKEIEELGKEEAELEIP